MWDISLFCGKNAGTIKSHSFSRNSGDDGTMRKQKMIFLFSRHALRNASCKGGMVEGMGRMKPTTLE